PQARGRSRNAAGLWADDVPVLRSTPAAQLATSRLSGCYPLVRNNGDEPHAIHGVGWQRPWTELDSDAGSAMLAYEHRPDAAWPFAFDCSHTLRLTARGLEMTLALTNQSDRPAPAGLGWHPYFHKRPGSRIAFYAQGRWEMGPDKLPTRRVPSRGEDADCATLDVDHCYDGWDGVVHLRDDALALRVTSPLTRVVVFNSPTRDYYAVEPVSHVNNAVHLHASGAAADALGLAILRPGDSMMAQMAIEVEPA
ncbi:MAG: aldose 1-epimerase, partial [Comamonadaceae bacterium]